MPSPSVFWSMMLSRSIAWIYHSCHLLSGHKVIPPLRGRKQLVGAWHALDIHTFPLLRFFCGFTELVTDGNKDLNRALKERNAEEAWEGFQKLEMADRGCVNKLLTLLAYEGSVESLSRAHNLLSHMEYSKFLDTDSLSLLALSYARSGLFENAAATVRMQMRNDSFVPTRVWTSIVEVLSKKPSGARIAMSLFFRICGYIREADAERSCGMKPDRESFRVVLEACTLAGDSIRAEKIFDLMRLFGIAPDDASFVSLIEVYRKEGNVNNMGNVLSRLKEAGGVPRPIVLSTLVSAYVSLREMDLASRIALVWAQSSNNACVDVSKENPKAILKSCGKALQSPNTNVFVSIVEVFLSEACFTKAAGFLIDLNQFGRGSVSPIMIIDGLLEHSLNDETHVLLQEMANKDSPLDLPAYASLIKSYSKVGNPTKAEEVLQDAMKAGYQPDMTCYAAMADAYICLQDYMNAFLVFRLMKQVGVEPLEPTFHRLLEIFKDRGKPALMRKVLEVALLEPPIVVELHQWNETIESFCDCRMMFDAKVTVNRMKQLGYCPDVATYSLMLNGYYAHGDKSNEILMLWVEVMGNGSEKGGGLETRQLSWKLLNGFLFAFVRYGFFRRALELISLMEQRKYSINKEVYRRLYYKHHKDLYLGKHTSQKRIDKSKERREQVQMFKRWLGF